MEGDGARFSATFRENWLIALFVRQDRSGLGGVGCLSSVENGRERVVSYAGLKCHLPAAFFHLVPSVDLLQPG